MANLKQTLSKKILDIPGVTERFWENETGGFRSFIFKNKDFAHFHKGNELDLRLTRKVIAREKLKHPQGSVDHPNRAQGSPWIELRFETEDEVLNICRLVELAIKQI